MPARPAFRILLVSLPWLSVAATCSGPPSQTLKLDDDDRFIPSGRISYEVMPGNATRRPGSLLDLATGAATDTAEAGDSESAPSSNVHRSDSSLPVDVTISLDAAFSEVEGRDRRSVPAGKQIEFNGVIAGPAELAVDAESLHGYVAGRGGFRIADMISLEAILGLGVDRTRVAVRSGSINVDAGKTQPGFLVGGRATFRPVPIVDFYAQATLTIIDVGGDYGDSANTREHEVGAELNLTRNVAVFSGYRWWSYREEDMQGGSNVDLDVEGPTAGLSLKF